MDYNDKGRMKDKELRFILTQSCNYSCGFCNHEGMNHKVKRELSLDDYIYLFTVCKDNFNWRTVSLTGGEPLLYDQFDQLVKNIAEAKGVITVISNGTLLDKHFDSINLLRRINVSLHSLDEEKYDKIVRVKGQLPKVISNINSVRMNMPHVDVRLNVVLSKNVNSSLKDIKHILEFANSNGCSVKFIELANDKDKIVPMNEIKNMLEQLGLKGRTHDHRKLVMSDNVTITRTSCESAKTSNNVGEICAKNMDFFVTPSGKINHCFVTNEQSSILEEVKSRNTNKLITKLKTISGTFGKNCIYKDLNSEIGL